VHLHEIMTVRNKLFFKFTSPNLKTHFYEMTETMKHKFQPCLGAGTPAARQRPGTSVGKTYTNRQQRLIESRQSAVTPTNAARRSSNGTKCVTPHRAPNQDANKELPFANVDQNKHSHTPNRMARAPPTAVMSNYGIMMNRVSLKSGASKTRPAFVHAKNSSIGAYASRDSQ